MGEISILEKVSFRSDNALTDLSAWANCGFNPLYGYKRSLYVPELAVRLLKRLCVCSFRQDDTVALYAGQGHRLFIIFLGHAGNVTPSMTLKHVSVLLRSATLLSRYLGKATTKLCMSRSTRYRRGENHKLSWGINLAVITQGFSTHYEGVRVTGNFASVHSHGLLSLHTIPSARNSWKELVFFITASLSFRIKSC